MSDDRTDLTTSLASLLILPSLTVLAQDFWDHMLGERADMGALVHGLPIW